MTENLTRQQRRQMMREEAKKQYTTPTPTPQATQTSNITQDQFQLIVQDLQRILNYAKVIDNHVWSLVETLSRKNILNWTDVNETESLYAKRDQMRKDRIKELLAEDKTVPEYLEAIIDDPSLPSYEKLNLHPIKDLNLNPYEVAAYIKELNPDLKEEEYVAMTKEWNLTGEHYGFRKDEENK